MKTNDGNLSGLQRILVLLLTFIAGFASGAAEPDKNWRFMTTEHFVVIYDASSAELAQVYANTAEWSLEQLKPYFSEWPDQTVVVLNDDTDQANGYATRLPRPLIHLNPVLPREGDSIGHFGRWSYELMLHEMVHIMTFEPAGGIYTPLRFLFGSISSPLMLMPRWWLEGIAVDLETRLSDFGRLRSPQLQAMVRAQIPDNQIDRFNISLINETLSPDWPGGQRPYAFGAMLWHEMIEQAQKNDRKPGEFVDSLNQRYSRRVPFLIEGPVEDQLDKTYQELLTESFERIKTKVKKDQEILDQVSMTELKAIHFENGESRVQLSPAISPDGLSMAYVAHNMNNPNEITIVQRPNWQSSFVGARATHQIAIKGTYSVSWHPSAPIIVFDQVKKRGYYGSGFDLYSYDLTTKKTTRLTHQQRAREPALNEQGQMTFIAADAGRTHLMLSSLDAPEKTDTLLTSLIDQRFSNPIWLDQQNLLFVSRGPNEKARLKKVHIPSKEVTDVLGAEWNVTYLARSLDAITFASARSGISNIYEWRENLVKPLTHVATGVFDSNYHKGSNTLVTTSYTANGEQVQETQSAGVTQEPPTVEPFYRFAETQFDVPTTKTSIEQEYRAGPYMWPQYWMPFILPYDDGILYQATTAASDPLGRHAYTATLSYDTFSKATGFGTVYTNATSAYPWTGALSDTSYILRALNTVRHDSSQSISVGFAEKNTSSDWSYNVGLTHSRSEILGTSVYRMGPTFSMGYSDATIKGKMIAPEKGKTLSIASRHYPPDTSNLVYSQFQVSGSYYQSSFLPKRHSLSMSSNLLYTPENIPDIYGGTTASSPQSLLGGSYLMRGYLTGQFLGQNLWTASLEYRFPLSELAAGVGTLPLFLRRIHSRVVLDTLTMDGFALTKESVFQATKRMERFFYGGGLEFYLDANVGYSYPLSFFLGIYQPLNSEISEDPVILINFLL